MGPGAAGVTGSFSTVRGHTRLASCRRHPERKVNHGWRCTRRCKQALRTLAYKAESPTEKMERRLRESQRVEERVIDIYDMGDFMREVEQADDSLVVLEIDSQEVCQSGLIEEAELHWREDTKRREEELWAICNDIKHVFQRTARECPDVKFLALDADTDTGSQVCDQLGVEMMPTLQFYRRGKLLWEHKGALELQQDLGEGVLYYGDTYAGGGKASEHVEELKTSAELQAFVNSQKDNCLAVVDISLSTAEPCIRIFPAVLALARSFQGYAAFGRFLGDTESESQKVLKEYDIQQVPTFLFFRGGKRIDRLVSSSRADLIGHILELQNAIGISPPPAIGKGKRRRSRVNK